MLNFHKHHVLGAETAALLTVEGASKTLTSTPDATNEQKAQSIQEVLAALAELLSDVQGQTANLQGQRGQMNANLQQLIAQNLQNAADNIANQIQKAIEAQQHESFWDKLINGLMAVVGAIVSVFAPEVGIPMMIMAICNLTGLTDKITSAITDALEKMGMSKQAAEMVSQIIIFVAVTAISMGSSIGADTSDLATIVKAAASFGQGLSMAPSLFSDIATYALTSSNMSDADKKKLEQDLAIVQAVLGALLMISSGGAQFASSACREVGEAGTLGSKLLSKLAKIGETEGGMMIRDFMKSVSERLQSMLTSASESIGASFSRLMPKTAEYISGGAKWFAEIGAKPFAMTTQLGCTVGIGANSYVTSSKLADTQETIGQNEANLILMQNEIKVMNNDTTSDIQAFSQRLQNQSKMMASIVGYIETEGQSYIDAASNL